MEISGAVLFMESGPAFVVIGSRDFRYEVEKNAVMLSSNQGKNKKTCNDIKAGAVLTTLKKLSKLNLQLNIR